MSGPVMDVFCGCNDGVSGQLLEDASGDRRLACRTHIHHRFAERQVIGLLRSVNECHFIIILQDAVAVPLVYASYSDHPEHIQFSCPQCSHAGTSKHGDAL